MTSAMLGGPDDIFDRHASRSPRCLRVKRSSRGGSCGYSGLTREAYMLDLRQYVAWCAERTSRCSERRVDIEAFGRHLEAVGRARATISRRLCTIACFYRYAEQEDFIAKMPSGACAATQARLRSARHRTGPQRSRGHARRRRARRCARPCASQPASTQRAASVGSNWREHRGTRSRARTPHAHDPAQERQDCHHSARAAHRPRDGSRGRYAAKGRCSSVSTVNAWTVTRQPGSWRASPAKPGSPSGSDPTRSGTRSSPPRSTPAFPSETSKKPQATPTPGRPCVTTELESRSTATPRTSSRRFIAGAAR